ncbi:MAG: hypothetical protein HYX69_21280 [Planctomycetia bacterium]|nr:hypothetical protein [Planctomycetia bacterium]
MNARWIHGFVGLSLVLLSGAAAQLAFAYHDDAQSAKEVEAGVKAALAKLTPADRALAEAQRWCPVMPDDRLGAMDQPIKIMLDGKPVFLCCEECEKDARADAKATLAKVEKLKKVNAAMAKLAPADRQLAEAQRYCAVQNKNELGSMGTPIKVMVEGQPAFLCCASCKKSAVANSKATLDNVKKLKAEHGPGHEHDHGDHK